MRLAAFLKVVVLLHMAYALPAPAADVSMPAIAMLEDYADTHFVEPNKQRISYEPRVRAVFLKGREGWRPFCAPDRFGDATHCPQEHFVHFAKLYGFQEARTEKVNTDGALKPESCCEGVAWLHVKDKHHITHEHGDRLLKWAGHLYDPVKKPEVLINRAAPIKDPEGWAATTRQVRLVAETYRSIAAMVQKVLLCRFGDERAPQRFDVPWRDEHLHISERFQSRDGRLLIKVKVSEAYAADCKRLGAESGAAAPEAGILYPEFWLVQTPDGKAVIHVFKSKANGYAKLQLIQFGDFDGDGNSEALFFRAGYNEDGYALFHEGMTKVEKFTWGYH